MARATSRGEPTAMSEIVVRHALGSYPVYVEAGALGRLGAVVERWLPRRRIALVTESTVRKLFEPWRSGEPSPWRAPDVVPELPSFAAELSVPAGEASKTRDWWAELSDALLEHGF